MLQRREYTVLYLYETKQMAHVKRQLFRCHTSGIAFLRPTDSELIAFHCHKKTLTIGAYIWGGYRGHGAHKVPQLPPYTCRYSACNNATYLVTSDRQRGTQSRWCTSVLDSRDSGGCYGKLVLHSTTSAHWITDEQTVNNASDWPVIESRVWRTDNSVKTRLVIHNISVHAGQ